MSGPEPIVTFRRGAAGLDRPRLESFARELQQRVARRQAFDCLITSDRELQDLNRSFRGEDYPTDVLSFPAESKVDSLGELAISRRRAAAQARQFGHTVEEEICILMLHGVLHLVGLDHETDSGAMRRTESRWRRKLGLPTGLIQRMSS